MSTAFVVGHTGKTGRALCKTLAAESRFSRVVLIGRKAVDTNELGPGLECRVVDFSNLKPEDFQGFEQGFCSLGTTPRNGREEFVKIDRDLVVRVAELAKQGGCRHFHLVTSQGAKKDSFSFYWHIKHEAEQGVLACGFEQLSIYRPGMILYERSENNFRTQFNQSLFKPFEFCMPSRITTPIGVMITAMLSRSKVEGPNVKTLETQDMLQLFKEAQQKK